MRERINGTRINIHHVSANELDLIELHTMDRLEIAFEELRIIQDEQARRAEHDMTNTSEPMHSGAAAFVIHEGLMGPPEDCS